MTPRVTCILLTYNHERFVERALDSVLHQDYPPDALQIVVVNDGSSDATAERLRPYLSRIEYVSQPNCGQQAALNRGLERASGEFIAILDGDDMWLPDKLTRLATRLCERPEVGLVYGDMTIVDEVDHVVHPSFFQYAGIQPLRGRVLGALLRSNWIGGGALMFRASLKHLCYPMPRFVPHGDWWIVTRIASVAELDYVDGPVNLYRRHSNNTVLEVDAARQARLLRDELPWRRWLLQTLTPDQIDPDSFLQAYLTFELVAARAAAAAGTTASMLVAANSADREKAHACLELGLTEYAAGRQPQAVHAFIQSLGFDPWNLASRHILQSLASSVGQIFGLDRPPVSEVEDATTRPFTVLAFADEVLADPDLLADYARHFTSADPATLLLYAPDAHPPTISQAFSDLLAGLGLNDESGPDIVAHVVPRSADGDRYLAHCVDAVLSRQTQQCRFERVASFQSPRLHELRSAAELYWKTQANSPAR